MTEHGKLSKEIIVIIIKLVAANSIIGCGWLKGNIKDSLPIRSS